MAIKPYDTLTIGQWTYERFINTVAAKARVAEIRKMKIAEVVKVSGTDAAYILKGN